MCRLFGLSSAPQRTHATFWLLDAPDSLDEQSRREPDGTGLGYFDAGGSPHVHKAAIAAWRDRTFAREAKHLRSRTFIAHVRFASTGGLSHANTHPFQQDGRLFAHNGVIEGLPELEAHLGADMAAVHGDTDSERFFTLISREIRDCGDDIARGIERAVRWIADELPVHSLNFVLTTGDELWALRYPDTHGLHLLHRRPGGDSGDRHLDHKGTGGRIRVQSLGLLETSAVVVASEPMDDDPGWRMMAPGELVHVSADLTTTSHMVLVGPPAKPLRLDDLRPVASASQWPS